MASFLSRPCLPMVILPAGPACAGGWDKQFAEAAAAGDIPRLTLLLEQEVECELF